MVEGLNGGKRGRRWDTVATVQMSAASADIAVATSAMPEPSGVDMSGHLGRTPYISDEYLTGNKCSEQCIGMFVEGTQVQD